MTSNRRYPRGVTFGFVALFLTLSVLSGAARSQEWPQFRGEQPNRATASDSTGTILVPIWTFRAPQVVSGGLTFRPDINATAAISDGTVFVGSRNTRFYALDAATGGLKWEYDAGSPISSSALVRDGAVYFSAENGALTRLNTADGAVQWRHFSGGGQDRASPNVSGGNIISGAAFPQRKIYAVPINSPNPAPEAWSFPTAQFVFSSPAVDPATGNIYQGSNDGRLYALTPNGAPLWPAQFFQTTGGIFRSSPTVANGKVYLSGGDYDWALHAVNAATGLLAWTTPMTPTPTLPTWQFRGIQISSPAVDGDFVTIVGGYGREGAGPSILYAWRDAGAAAIPLWTLALPNAVNDSYVSSPVITQNSVMVGVAAAAVPASPELPRGRVYLANRANGEAHWFSAGVSGDRGGPVLSSPAVAGDLVVIGDQSGLVTAYHAGVAGDVDGDGVTTVLDIVRLANYSSADGVAPVIETAYGDVHPTNAPRADGARSFGNLLITPGDIERLIDYAIGLETRVP
jgi:outer membrane protein assembly factor BamB